MSCNFQWDVEPLGNNKEAAESAIVDALDSGHMPFSTCHSGALTVRLSACGPLKDDLAGHFQCSCGRKLGTIVGQVNGAQLQFAAIKE